jgi:uncharacterized protein
MAGRYREIYSTPDVVAAQAHYFGQQQAIPKHPERDPLTAEVAEFIARRDSFYMATVTSDGWPYLQHRGGPAGFLKVLDPQRMGFADFRGNRQLLSTGNLAGSDRVALFLMDYPHRERLKILGHARVLDARDQQDLVDRLAPTPELRGRIERLFLIDVISFDWNCPQYITPRYTVAEMEGIVAPFKERIATLEAQLRTAKQ